LFHLLVQEANVLQAKKENINFIGFEVNEEYVNYVMNG